MITGIILAAIVSAAVFIEVWNAKQFFVSKHGQGTGQSGIENPLFFKDNTRMFYGDAKRSIDSLLQLLPSKIAV